MEGAEPASDRVDDPSFAVVDDVFRELPVLELHDEPGDSINVVIHGGRGGRLKTSIANKGREKNNASISRADV
ncbi:MAG: hypothetical protein KIT13_05570 [Burkholderiales bacterium]|nr:hypothetical protein [Burkholderiales bacterium]